MKHNTSPVANYYMPLIFFYPQKVKSQPNFPLPNTSNPADAAAQGARGSVARRRSSSNEIPLSDTALPPRERGRSADQKPSLEEEQADRQGSFDLGCGQGPLPIRPQLSRRCPAHHYLPWPRQLRLAMLTWYCAEGSGHSEERPCQNYHFMQKLRKAENPELRKKLVRRRVRSAP